VTLLVGICIGFLLGVVAMALLNIAKAAELAPEPKRPETETDILERWAR
jgi:hypothetical protein